MKTLKDFLNPDKLKESVFLDGKKEYIILNIKTLGNEEYLEIAYLNSKRIKTSIKKINSSMHDKYSRPYNHR